MPRKRSQVEVENKDRLAQNLHLTTNSGSPSQWPVSGQEQSIESLGQSHIGCVIGGEVVAQLPDARQKGQMWDPAQRQYREIGQSLTRSPVIQPPSAGRASQSRNELKVHQLRCSQTLSAQTLADTVAIDAVISESRREH